MIPAWVPESAPAQLVKRTYQGATGEGIIRQVYRCHTCQVEFERSSEAVCHMASVHGIVVGPLPELHSPEQDSTTSVAQVQQVRRLHLPNGDCKLACPVCDELFPEDGSALFEHSAAKHGLPLALHGHLDGGESEHLDKLHQESSENWHPRREEVLDCMHVISLGSYCGMKFSMQRLGLGGAHLPFDWIRTTSAGVRHFVQNEFRDFFSVSSQCSVPGTGLRVHRSEFHSFWHDDISKESTQIKLQRRIHRFLALRDDPKDVLFLRSCACTDELAELEDLYAVLSDHFRSPCQSSRRVLLVVVVDGQLGFEGPFVHKAQPEIMVFKQPLSPDASVRRGEAYCRAISSAVTLALALPNNSDLATPCGQELLHGKATVSFPQTLVSEAADHTDGTGINWSRSMTFCDAGLHSGYDGIVCFDESSSERVDLRATGKS
jgi:hypothetical protein